MNKQVIVIPTYNEKDNINILVPAIFKIMPNISVVVADDNSPDGTGQRVLELQKDFPNLRLISRPIKNGLGKAYINVFNQLLPDRSIETIIMMDADLSHKPEYLPVMIEKSRDFTVVVGSRYVPGSVIIGWELWRRVLSGFANFYCRTITRLPIRDCTSGFNAISADLLRQIDLSKMDTSGYAFIMELKYLLYKAGGTFYELPFRFVNRVGGESKISSHIISEGIIAPWKIRF